MVIKLLLMFLYYTIINSKKEISRKNTIEKEIIINKPKTTLIEEQKEQRKELLATISIKEINLLDKPIYKKNSPENNIEKNITILHQKENITVLAAHSGIGPIAYFKDLHKLHQNSQIEIKTEKITYTYKVIQKEEREKRGNIEIPKGINTKTLVLTTCSENKEKQLLLISTLDTYRKN